MWKKWKKNKHLYYNLRSVNTWIWSLSLSASFLSHSLIRFFNRSSVSLDKSDPPAFLQSSNSTSRLEISSRSLDKIQGYCEDEKKKCIWKVFPCERLYLEKNLLDKPTFPFHKYLIFLWFDVLLLASLLNLAIT